MKKVLPQQIYSEFHKWRTWKSQKIFPKRIVNFDKIFEKNPEAKTACEKFAQFINRNNGMIDYKIFIKACILNNDNNYVNINIINNKKSIGIYKKYIKRIRESDDELEQRFLDSLTFVIKYCVEFNITFDEYCSEGAYGYPTLLKHYNAGSIDVVFLIAIPGFIYILEQYQEDIIHDFFDIDDFLKYSERIAMKINLCDNFKKWKKIIYNINKLIIKYKEKQKAKKVNQVNQVNQKK